jgi:mono/diheme cytochrome c family protein
VEIGAANGENSGVAAWLQQLAKLLVGRGGTVKRNYAILGIATLAVAGALLAQDQPEKTTAKKGGSHGGAATAAAVARGKEVYEKSCAICHFADKDTKKIGPGLKGLSKRGTFTVNGAKVTTEALTTWIENGDSMMPGMKESLEPAQIKDVVAYVKTL